jgi:hypothetical protein
MHIVDDENPPKETYLADMALFAGISITIYGKW